MSTFRIPNETLYEAAPIGSSRWMWWSLLVGAAFGLGLILAAIFNPTQFCRAYLAAYLWCLNIGLGSTVLLMIYHITGGGWGFLLRRVLEAASKTLPLLAVGFVPVAIGAPVLYLWAQPEAVSANELLQKQHVYMNLPLWCVRAAVYFGLWLIISCFVNRWSRLQDESGDPRLRAWLNTLSGVGLLIYGVTIHFAAVDWVLSLHPEYHSTICGPLLASQQMLSGLSFAIITFVLLCNLKPISDLISKGMLNDLGSLLLALLVVWSYMWWFEFMLVWIANLPADLVWYVPRSRGGWQWLAVTLAAFGFATPFLLLLQKSLKQRPAMLGAMAALILISQLGFTHWQILPAFDPENFGACWISLIAPPALGGMWLSCFIWLLRRRPLLAQNDPHALTIARLKTIDQWESQWEEALAHG